MRNVVITRIYPDGRKELAPPKEVAGRDIDDELKQARALASKVGAFVLSVNLGTDGRIQAVVLVEAPKPPGVEGKWAFRGSVKRAPVT